MTSMAAPEQTFSAEWTLPAGKYGIREQDVIDRWDLDERSGIAMVIKVDTSWFSPVRWVALINEEIDGSEAAVWESAQNNLITTYSTKRRGADHVRKRIIGSPVLTVKSFDLSAFLVDKTNDIPYFGVGKAHAIAEEYDSMDELMAASINDLAAIKNMSQTKAEQVYAVLHDE